MTKSLLLRQRVLLEYGSIKSLRKCSSKFNVSKSIISKWVRTAKMLIPITKKKSKTQPSYYLIIYNYIKLNPLSRLKDIQYLLITSCKIKLSITKIFYILKELKITKKRTKRIVRKSKLYAEKLEKQRLNYIKLVKNINFDNVISIDESGFTKEMFPHYGYALKGTKIIKKTTSQKHNNYSLIMAITNKLVIAHHITKGAVNKNIFYNFLISKLLPSCSEHTYTFILDNVRFHHSKVVKDIITSKGHNILYTPPYSPVLNPVERVFSIIKTNIRRRECKSIKELKTEIIRIICSIKSFNKIFSYSLLNKELSAATKRRIIFI